MDDASLARVLHRAADAVANKLSSLEDWGPTGTRAGQYRSDIVADQAAVAVLGEAGLGVFSEESGRHGGEGALTVVLDPVDGSTNAARGLPWYATSLCALDEAGPRVAVVVNLASGVRYQAIRSGGATRDGRPIAPTACGSLASAIIGLNGYPARHLGWHQFRAMGAAALDLCAVADGELDAYLDCTGTLASWDYLGGWLVCAESGASVVELGDDLFEEVHGAGAGPPRPRSLAAATPELLAQSRRSLLERGGGAGR
jgi:fructose-1,6-bisphosphatase/inositol monophosphatase family enzyme